MIRTSVTRALIASFLMFPTVSKLMLNATDLFVIKNFSKDFLISKFVINKIN